MFIEHYNRQHHMQQQRKSMRERFLFIGQNSDKGAYFPSLIYTGDGLHTADA